MKLTTHQRGQVAQLKVEQQAILRGFIVSRPSVDTRYDVIIDDGKLLQRVQVKYASGEPSHSDGAVNIPLRKPHKNRALTYSSVDVDMILVYVPEVDKIVRLLPEHFNGKPQVVIRLKPPANGQVKGINRLEDFLW